MNESELSVNPQHEWDGTFFHSVNSLATEQELAFLLAGLEGTGWLARAPLDLILLELGKLISYWTLKCWKEKLSIHETEEEDDETLTPDPIHSWSSTCKCLKEGRLNSLWMRVNYWTWKCWKERLNETQHESELSVNPQDEFFNWSRSFTLAALKDSTLDSFSFPGTFTVGSCFAAAPHLFWSRGKLNKTQ